MRVFGRRAVEPFAVPRAANGHGCGELVCAFGRRMYGSVAVVGTHDYAAGRRSIAGPRPHIDIPPWRERLASVRLVLEGTDHDDPTRIAVVSRHGRMVGHVEPGSARRIGSVIDGALRHIATKHEFKGCSVDVQCSALVEAEWSALDPRAPAADDQTPIAVVVTLLLDDGDLDWKLSGPGLIASPW